MNLFNPLPPIWENYKMSMDGLKVLKRAVKTKNTSDRQRLLQRTFIQKQTPEINNADTIVENAETDIQALFVVKLWAEFERFLRTYLQTKCAILKNITPIDLGDGIYDHFFKEVNYWKPDDILDFLKLNVLKNNEQLAGSAKDIYRYRSDIVHGNQVTQKIYPDFAHTTLDRIVQILLANV
jgi:hypothetical protein